MDLRGLDNVLKNLDRFEALFTTDIEKAINKAVLLVEREAKKNLKRKGLIDTGRLHNDIKGEIIKITKDLIMGGVGTSVIYARIHELGGVIKPKRAKALKFKIGDKWITAKRVKIRKKPYLYPALANNIDKIVEIIKESFPKGL